MRIPVIQGVIDRRILANIRVDPERLQSLLPKPFRPKLIYGYGMAVICLIRLRELRPRGVPAMLGVSTPSPADVCSPASTTTPPSVAPKTPAAMKY